MSFPRSKLLHAFQETLMGSRGPDLLHETPLNGKFKASESSEKLSTKVIGQATHIRASLLDAIILPTNKSNSLSTGLLLTAGTGLALFRSPLAKNLLADRVLLPLWRGLSAFASRRSPLTYLGLPLLAIGAGIMISGCISPAKVPACDLPRDTVDEKVRAQQAAVGQLTPAGSAFIPVNDTASRFIETRSDGWDIYEVNPEQAQTNCQCNKARLFVNGERIGPTQPDGLESLRVKYIEIAGNGCEDNWESSRNLASLHVFCTRAPVTDFSPFRKASTTASTLGFDDVLAGMSCGQEQTDSKSLGYKDYLNSIGRFIEVIAPGPQFASSYHEWPNGRKTRVNYNPSLFVGNTSEIKSPNDQFGCALGEGDHSVTTPLLQTLLTLKKGGYMVACGDIFDQANAYKATYDNQGTFLEGNFDIEKTSNACTVKVAYALE